MSALQIRDISRPPHLAVRPVQRHVRVQHQSSRQTAVREHVSRTVQLREPHPKVLRITHPGARGARGPGVSAITFTGTEARITYESGEVATVPFTIDEIDGGTF